MNDRLASRRRAHPGVRSRADRGDRALRSHRTDRHRAARRPLLLPGRDREGRGGARRQGRRPRGVRDRPQPDLRAGHRRTPARARASGRRRAAGGGRSWRRLIARGCRTFVACGGAGVLVPDVALGHVIVPSVGDPGRGHVVPLPAGRHARSSPRAQAFDAIVATLERHHVPYVTGQDVDDRRPVPGDARQGRTPGRGGMPHGGDGGGGVLRGGRVPRGDVRSAALRGRRSLGRRVGRPRVGLARRRARAAVPARGRGVPVELPAG